MSWFAGSHCRDEEQKAREQDRLKRILEDHGCSGPGWDITYREDFDPDGTCLFGFTASPAGDQAQCHSK